MEINLDNLSGPHAAQYTLKRIDLEPVSETLLLFGETYIIGRSRSANIQIEDEKASRRHCRITFVDDGLTVEDLGSANGTFLNGRRLKEVKSLDNDDEIRIGNTRFKLAVALAVSEGAKEWWEQTQQTIRSAGSSRKQRAQLRADGLVAGSLATISLVDLLQLLSASQKTGVLKVSQQDEHGYIYLRDGQVISARIGERIGKSPEKTVYRLLRWKTGQFEFNQRGEIPDAAPIESSTQSLLLEGVQSADELSEFDHALPNYFVKLALAKPLPEPLHKLSREELILIQLILEHETWIDILDNFESTDVDASRVLVSLLQRKIVLAPAGK